MLCWIIEIWNVVIWRYWVCYAFCCTHIEFFYGKTGHSFAYCEERVENCRSQRVKFHSIANRLSRLIKWHSIWSKPSVFPELDILSDKQENDFERIKRIKTMGSISLYLLHHPSTPFSLCLSVAHQYLAICPITKARRLSLMVNKDYASEAFICCLFGTRACHVPDWQSDTTIYLSAIFIWCQLN